MINMARFLCFLLLPMMWNRVLAIDCYECYSFNESDKFCGDPFHPIYGHLRSDCSQGKEGHLGEFPAKYCIKLVGTTASDNIEMAFRGCSLESLESQCGDFKFEQKRYKGCVMTCSEDACNSTSGVKAHAHIMISVSALALIVISLFLQ